MQKLTNISIKQNKKKINYCIKLIMIMVWIKKKKKNSPSIGEINRWQKKTKQTDTNINNNKKYA